MRFEEANPLLQAADAHNVAGENSSMFEDVADIVGHPLNFLAVSVASAANSFYNTGATVGNIFKDEDNKIELRDTGEWISSYDEDLGKYYEDHKTAADIVGFIGGSLIPGGAAVKGLNLAQKALRAAEAGSIGSNMRWATNLLAPTMETYVKREAADLAVKRATFSFVNQNSVKALASGVWQNTLESAAFETAAAATMFKSPLLEDMDVGDIVDNALMGVGLGAAFGAVTSAAKTYFSVGSLLKNADARSMPFRKSTLENTGTETLASDSVVNKILDKKVLLELEPTTDYVLAAKRAAGEVGESLHPDIVNAEVTHLKRLREENLQRLDNEIRTAVRKVSKDDALANLVTDISSKLDLDDMQALYMNARGFARAGDMTEVERAAKKLVKDGEFKTVEEATKSLSNTMADTFIRLHSGTIGETIAGNPGFLRLADRLGAEKLDKVIRGSGLRFGERLDYREALKPEIAELRWITASKSDKAFPKNYVFGSHDLPALVRAERMGLDQITVQTGPGKLDLLVLNKGEIPDYVQQAKLEVLAAHKELGTPSDQIEMLTDLRKGFIEGVEESAEAAQASYARELSEKLGKEVSPVDLYQIPRFTKVTYDTRRITDEAGMEMKGAVLIKHRQKLAKEANDRYFAKFAGDISQTFPEIPEALFRSIWRGEGGAGTFTSAGGQLGSMASMASYIGNVTAELSKRRIQAVTEDVSASAQHLLTSQEDAVRFSTINAVVSKTPEKYVLAEDGASLIPYKYKQWMDEGSEGAMPQLHPGSPESIPLESDAIREVVAKHVSLSDKSTKGFQELNALQGNTDEKLLGVFRPIRPDPRDHKYVAFVKDESLVGVGHTTMLFAPDAQKLEEMINKVNELGTYKVYTEKQTQDFFKARGEYEYDKTLHENYVDTDLKSRGIMSEFLPKSDPQLIVNEWLQHHVRAENTLVKQSVLTKYEKDTTELKRLAEQWSLNKKSKLGTTSIDEILMSSEKNPYTGVLKSMLNITKVEEMPAFLRTANQAIDAVASTAWGKAQQLFGGSKYSPELADKIQGVFDELGFKSAYYDSATQILANSNIPRGVATRFVRAVNAFLTTTVLRLDFINPLVNVLGNAVLYAPEVTSVLGSIKKGDAASVGDLAKLANLTVPGTGGDQVFSASKLFANSLKRLHGEGSEALIAEYKKRGLAPDLSDQYFKSIDAATLTGAETVADMQSKLGKLGEAWEAFAKVGEKATGNKWSEQFNKLIAADAMKQLTEVAVKHGHMTEDVAWAYVNTFSNRINGVIRAAERPLMFQGPIGQAIGLFQSYQFNLMQQMFRNIGEGRTKQVAMMAGLQSTVFGASSLPGFNLINSHLIGQASGNEEHYDLFSATQAIFGQEGADWLMYGAPSNILNASLFTRGDTNPRSWSVVPNPTNPSEIPFISSFAKVFEAIKGGINAQQGGETIWNSMLGSVEHLGMSRPLAGLAQVARGLTNPDLKVIATTKDGMITGSNDLVSFASLTRILGAKPLDEAIVTNGYFRIRAYAQKDAERREALGAQIKSQMANGAEIEDEAVGKFAEEYVKLGGKPTGFNQWWMNQYKNSTRTQAMQMVEKLDSPYARRMMEVLGGRDSLSDLDSF